MSHHPTHLLPSPVKAGRIYLRIGEEVTHRQVMAKEIQYENERE